MHQALNKTRRKKNVKKGIQFCLMVCGASGTGRTTFVNTLCGNQVLGHKEVDDPTTAHVEEGVKIKPITVGKFVYWRWTRPSRHEAATDNGQNLMRKVPASRSQLSTPLDLETRLTTRLGKDLAATVTTPTYLYAVSQRLSDTLSDSTMAFSPKSRVSSVTHASVTTVYTYCCTSSRLLVMGMCSPYELGFY